jgi:hypothetical protein
VLSIGVEGRAAAPSQTRPVQTAPCWRKPSADGLPKEDTSPLPG